MKPGRPLRTLVRAAVFPIDIALTLPWLALALLVALLARVRPRPRRRRAVFLVPGADLASIRKKFGSLDPFLDDALGGYFERVHRYLYRDTVARTLQLREDFVVHATRVPLRVLVLTYHARLAVAIAWRAWRESIAVLHAKDPYFCGLVIWLAAGLSRTPAFVSIHSDYDKWHAELGEAPTLLGSRALAKRLERFVLSRAWLVMPISHHLARVAIGNGARADRVRVAPHGVDFAALAAQAPVDVRARCGLDPEAPLVTFVGRLSPEKYAADALECGLRLTRLHPSVVVVLVGDGPLRDELRARRDHGGPGAGRIRMLGFQPRETCFAILQQSRVALCLLSGFSLIEAMASGAVPVVYDMEWHGELIDDGLTGLMVRPGDIDALAAAVLGLLEDHGRARAIGVRARRRALERYDAAVAVATKRACYQELESGGVA